MTELTCKHFSKDFISISLGGFIVVHVVQNSFDLIISLHTSRPIEKFIEVNSAHARSTITDTEMQEDGQLY